MRINNGPLKTMLLKSTLHLSLFPNTNFMVE